MWTTPFTVRVEPALHVRREPDVKAGYRMRALEDVDEAFVSSHEAARAIEGPSETAENGPKRRRSRAWSQQLPALVASLVAFCRAARLRAVALRRGILRMTIARSSRASGLPSRSSLQASEEGSPSRSSPKASEGWWAP